MCGIAGSWGGDPRRVEAMVAAMHHRGPDEQAVKTKGEAHLGAARLAIRGGSRGAQPFEGERGTLTLDAIQDGDLQDPDEETGPPDRDECNE